MAERPDQIEKHIASTRHELGNHLQELEHKVKQAADWKTYYERSPMTMVGVAFGGGVLLAAMMGGKRDRDHSPYVSQAARTAGYLTGSTQTNPIFDTWQNLKAALIGLSGAKLRGILDEALPGFSEHYDRASRANPSYSASSSHPQSSGYEAPSHRM